MNPSSTAARVRKTPEERRDEVSAVARALALDEGLEALTLRAVAARMQVAPGLVAHYVTSMDDLTADTFGALVRAELDEVTALVHAVSGSARRIGALLETLLDGLRADITLVWVQAWSLGVRNAILAARVREEMDAWHTLIADELRRGMDAGVFAEADASAVGWYLLAMIDGLNAQSLVRWSASRHPHDLVGAAVAALLGVDVADLGLRAQVPRGEGAR